MSTGVDAAQATATLHSLTALEQNGLSTAEVGKSAADLGNALGRALLRLKVGVGSPGEVSAARMAFQQARQREEEAELMRAALPSLRESLSTVLQLHNDEVTSKEGAKRRTAYDAALQQFEKGLRNRTIKAGNAKAEAMKVSSLANRAGFMSHFRGWLREHTNWLPSGFQVTDF